jgi:hypothetical protein
MTRSRFVISAIILPATPEWNGNLETHDAMLASQAIVLAGGGHYCAISIAATPASITVAPCHQISPSTSSAGNGSCSRGASPGGMLKDSAELSNGERLSSGERQRAGRRLRQSCRCS